MKKKRFTGKGLDLPVFSGLCLPFGLHSPVCTVLGERLLHLIKREPLSCPQMPKRQGPAGKMVMISHGNCGRVGDRLIIHSCVQEQLR